MYLKTPYIISFCSKAMFLPHVALYHFINLFQNDLAIAHSTNKWSGVVFDRCHGNKDNLVAVSFSSCARSYLYTEYYELFYIETWIVLLHL